MSAGRSSSGLQLDMIATQVKTLLAILVLAVAVFALRMVGLAEGAPQAGSGAGSGTDIASGLGGIVIGLPAGTSGTAVASAEGSVTEARLDDGGRFLMPDLAPGDHVVEVSVPGFDTGSAQVVTAPRGDLRFRATPLGYAGFVYRWRVDASEGGAEHGSSVLVPFTVETAAGEVEVPVHSAALRLVRELGQALDDDQRAWSQEHAQRLLESMGELGLERLPHATWALVDGHLPHDIEIEQNGERVRISTHAFTYAASRLARIGPARGRVVSRRLHHALVRWATDEGRDRQAVEQLLSDRFGSSLVVPDYEALTRTTTREHAGRFQQFRPAERLAILEQFEQLPEGMRRVPGLTYLVRRLDGTPHPMYSQAPAVSWPGLEAGYIEFMETAFSGSSLEHTQRLILHEKSHFLWARVFPEETRDEWIRVGRWTEDPEANGGWSTSLTTEFVSAHAHLINPDEDLAESLAWFVIDPEKLESRSPAKYSFVRDAIMDGRRYLSRLREDLVFQVDNEVPDYTYPGVVERVEVSVQGAPREDKLATVEIELARTGAMQDARGAVLRVINEAGVVDDVRLTPVDEAGEPIASGHILRGSLELSRYAKGGFWFPVQMTTVDSVGNERFEQGTDFGWKMFVESPLEDVEPPRYVPGSLRLTVETDASGERPVRAVVARWRVQENSQMAPGGRACATALARSEAGASRSITTYGSYDAESGICTTRTLLSEHRNSGTYSVTHLLLRDAAGNTQDVYFTGEGGDETARSVSIRSADSDERPPQLDVANILVSAEPTDPLAPDGETRVTIEYLARDDKSGLGQVSLQLRDPQGVEHHHYHYHENFHGDDFKGDPLAWRRYVMEIVLPVGSPPGSWGLSSMLLEDKAGNAEGFDFTETLQFELIEP
jgi:hypothetical protein